MTLFYNGHVISGRPEEITEFLRLNVKTALAPSTDTGADDGLDPDLAKLIKDGTIEEKGKVCWKSPI